jgi:hypothetical protein
MRNVKRESVPPLPNQSYTKISTTALQTCSRGLETQSGERLYWCRAWKAEKDVAVATEKEAAILHSAKHGVEDGYPKPKHLVQSVEVLQCLWQNDWKTILQNPNILVMEKFVSSSIGQGLSAFLLWGHCNPMAYPKPTGDINNHFSEDMPGWAFTPISRQVCGAGKSWHNETTMSVHCPEWDLTLSNNFSTWHTGRACHLNTQILWVKGLLQKTCG